MKNSRFNYDDGLHFSRYSESMIVTMHRGASNIFEVFLSSNNFMCSVGFLPFRVDVKKRNIHERSVYYPAFFLSLYSTVFLFLCWLGQQEPEAEESLLIRYGSFVLNLQFISVIIFVVLFNYFKRHEIANCLLVMHHFDCALEVGQMRWIVKLHSSCEWLTFYFFRIYTALTR